MSDEKKKNKEKVKERKKKENQRGLQMEKVDIKQFCKNCNHVKGVIERVTLYSRISSPKASFSQNKQF